MCSIMALSKCHVSMKEFEEAFSKTVSRGPDMQKVIQVSDSVLGFQRLSIMGLTEAGMQPFELDGNYAICNGELYGFKKVREELKADGYKFFPNVYAMSAKSSLLDTSAFVGPTKIIGIKPKKLVIADDGYAFYTDSDMLYYKNVNRVVTIDLERFVIETVQLTKATFDSELTDYFKSGSSIDKIRSGGTYYDYGATVYYYDSSSREESGTIGFGSNFYLAVKNGDNQ